MVRTKRDPRLELPPLELECMKALWTLGEGTVNSVRDMLLASRPLAYTTVMTIMDRLARKGAVERIMHNRAYVYRPAVSEERVRRQALDRLLTEHFEGSQENLNAYLNGKEVRTAESSPSRPDRPLPNAATHEPKPAATNESAIDEALL
jgi:predicted transcriptional regulator